MPGQATRGARGCPGAARGGYGLGAAGGDRGTGRAGPRRARLRHATAAPHRGLEARLEAAGCFDRPDGYALHLRTVAPLYAALEGMLDDAGAGRWLPDWPRRRKAGLIRADLRAIGAGEPAAFPTRAAVAAALPPAWHAGAVLAVLYVLEGATLGGAVLARRAERLGLAPGCGASFLDPYGADRGAMWRGYLHALEGAELAPGEEAGLCPWAAATFSLFAEWAPVPHPRALPAAAPPP